MNKGSTNKNRIFWTTERNQKIAAAEFDVDGNQVLRTGVTVKATTVTVP